MNAQERVEKNFPAKSSRTPKPGKHRPPHLNRCPLGAALPLSETGKRLTNLFPNGWDWIYAAPSPHHDKPQWETIKGYPLCPVEMWSHHQAPNILIGIRPAATTRWGIIDIDRHSRYHPAQDPEALQTIQNTLEDIGITRTILNQSSCSGGLHLYIPLPETVSSYWLSITLKYHLEAAGIQIHSGQCELFPNPKRYIPKGQGFSHFNGIRLPMQPDTGFIPLDADLTPLPWSLEDWLDTFDLAASHQDHTKLTQQIEDAKQNHKIRTHRNPHSIATWRDRIEQEKIQGWTGSGQTNEKLKIFACEARVFLGMDSLTEIANHIEQTALNTPGFHTHSNHTHNIAQRSREIAQWAIRYYWPLGAAPSRETGYHSPPAPVASFSYHQAKREAAQHRIQSAIAQLIESDQLPPTAGDRASAIIAIAHVSKKTLYSSATKPLWHPDHLPTPSPSPTITPSSPTQPPQETPSNPIPEQASFQPNPQLPKISLIQPLETLLSKVCLLAYKNVGFVILTRLLEAFAALTPLKGQRAASKAITQSSFPKGGSPRGEIVLAAAAPSRITSFAELKATLSERLQAKIAQAERVRHREQVREQQRRQRAQTRQLSLTLSPQPDRPPIPPPQRSPFASTPLPSPALTQDPPLQRSPSAAEQREFETWYALAEQFKLVSDYQWDNGEYWVESNGQCHSYCELSGTFTTRRLRQYLNLDPEN